MFFSSFAMTHQHSRSEPVRHTHSQSAYVLSSFPPEEGGSDIESQCQHLNPVGVAPLDDPDNQLLAAECSHVIEGLESLQSRLRPVPVDLVPHSFWGSVKYRCVKTGRWVSSHKGKITLIVIGGAICVYFGYFVGVRGIQQMRSTCDDARCKAEDLMGLVKDVEPLAQQTFAHCSEASDRCEAARSLLATVLTMVKNGSLAFCKDGAEVCSEMLETLRHATDFGLR
jgi:hypothetical protein